MKRHVLAEISQAGKEDFFKDFMDQKGSYICKYRSLRKSF